MPSKLRKLAVGLILTLVLVCLIMPKVIGLFVGNFINDDALAMLPPEMRALLSVQDISYASGWFRSEAELTLEYAPLDAYEGLALPTTLHVQHGPLLVTRDGLTLGLAYADIEPHSDNADLQSLLADIPFALPTTRITLLTSFTGAVQLRVAVDGIDYTTPGAALLLDGLHLSFTARPDLSTHSQLRVNQLQAQAEDSGFNVSLIGLVSEGHTRRHAPALATGDMQLLLEHFSSTSPLPIVLEDLRSDSSLHDDTDATLRFNQHLSIPSIDSELPLSAIELDLDIGDLQLAALQRFSTLAADVQASANANPGVLTPVMTEALGEAALLLLNNPLTLNLALRADAYGGDHAVDLALRWSGLPNLTEIARLDLREALAALMITLDLSLDLEAAARSSLAPSIDPYVQQGYLQLDNGRIILQARLENLTIRLNDQTLTADELL